MTVAADAVLQLYANGVWNDITADSRGDIEIRRGYADASDALQPTRMTFTLNNRDGKYSPRNPTGTYYGQIGRNTPVRLVAGFNTVPAYRSVASASSGSTSFTCAAPAGVVAGDILIALQATDLCIESGMTSPTGGGTGDGAPWRVLTMATDGRNSVFPASMRVWWKRAGGSEPANYTFTQDSGSDSVVIIAAASGVLDVPVVSRTFVTTTSSSTTDTPSTVPTKSNDLEFRFATAKANVTWTAPGTLTERADLVSGTFVSATLATRVLASSAATGVQTFTSSAGGTYRHAVTINLSSRSVRCSAFVNEWPQEWLPGGVDVWVPIEASGVLRRLNSKLTGKPVFSVARREIGVNHSPAAYWPMEEQSGSTQFTAATTGQRPIIPSSGVSIASNSSIISSKALPTVASGESIYLAQADMHPATTAWTIVWLTSVASETPGAANIFGWDCVNGTIARWRITITNGAPAALQVLVYDSASANFDTTNLTYTHAAGGAEMFNSPVAMYVKAYQNGADVNVEFGYADTLDNSNVSLTSVTDTYTNRTLGNISQIYAENIFIATVTGHIAIFNSVGDIDMPDFRSLLRAQAGPYADGYAGQRIKRLCAENDVPFVLVGNLNRTSMGAQGVDTLAALIQECVDADGGWLFEPRDASSLGYRDPSSMYGQAALALTYTSSHLSGLKASEDDRLIANDVTTTRKGGTSARSMLATGALSVLDPPNGVGTYDSSFTVNVYADAQAQYIADWVQHLGTRDEPRYSEMQLELARAPYVASATLTANVAMLDIGDRITVASPPVWLPPDSIDVLIRGINERVGSKTWTFDINTVPAGPYSVLEFDNATYDRLDSADTTLQNALSAGGTSAQFVVAGTTGATATSWSTADVPYDVKMSGERATVTAMTSPAATFVAAGAVATAVNASVTPALPAGVTTGDLLLVFTAIRNSGTGTPNAPTGYTALVSYANMALYGKIHSGTESAPTVTFTAGAAGDDTSAQMAAFRGAQASVIASATQLNGSVQDIATPACSVLRDRCLVLYLGWKQDDWTSVATVSGATEIGDLPTTTGNDQGLVWDYVIQTTAASIAAATSFTVTGGAVAISRGVVLALAGDVQTATLTRAVNGVSKAQTAGTAVSLFSPGQWAL